MTTSDRQNFANYAVPLASAGALVVLILWQIYFPDSMDWWAKEDGPFEYATVLFYGVSSLIFWRMARRGNFPLNSTRRFGQIILITGALGCFFIMGEEISWGQRIIGWDTPESWAEMNYQQETTLHNLDWVYTNLTSSETGIFRANFFNLLFVGMGLGLPVIALIPWARSLIARLAIPIIPLRYAILFVGAWLYGKLLVDPTGHENPSEVREALFSVGILMFALVGLKRPWELYRVTAEEMSLTD